MSSELRSRVKENWLSFVHRLEFTSKGRSQSPLIDIFTHYLPVVIQKQKLNAE